MIPTFKALFMAFIKSFVAGLISTLIVYLLFFDFYKTRDSNFMDFIGMIFFNLLLSIGFCGAVLFPISVMEKEADKNVPIVILFRRYLPFITLPLFTLFCVVLFMHDPSRYYSDSDFYFCTRALILAFCIGTTGLWTYLKNKQS